MKNKGKIILSVVGMVVSLSLLITSAILAENKIINVTSAIILSVIAIILVWIAIFYAAKIDYETGIYECRKCGHTFKPTFKAYICGAHTLKTRHLKCPECEEKSWCIRKRENPENPCK